MKSFFLLFSFFPALSPSLTFLYLRSKFIVAVAPECASPMSTLCVVWHHHQQQHTHTDDGHVTLSPPPLSLSLSLTLPRAMFVCRSVYVTVRPCPCPFSNMDTLSHVVNVRN